MGETAEMTVIKKEMEPEEYRQQEEKQALWNRTLWDILSEETKKKPSFNETEGA